MLSVLCCSQKESLNNTKGKKNFAKLNCAVGHVREKLEKLSWTNFFSGTHFHFNFVQVAQLAMDAAKHP